MAKVLQLVSINLSLSCMIHRNRRFCDAWQIGYTTKSFNKAGIDDNISIVRNGIFVVMLLVGWKSFEHTLSRPVALPDAK